MDLLCVPEIFRFAYFSAFKMEAVRSFEIWGEPLPSCTSPHPKKTVHLALPAARTLSPTEYLDEFRTL
jgi:hypothetical protein